MVLIILLRIAVKTTTNCCIEVPDPDAGSCLPLHAASSWIYIKSAYYFTFRCFYP